MTEYVLKRFFSMLVTLFLVATVTFFLMHAVPGQPFQVTRDTPESVRVALEEKYGLNKPLGTQYLLYMNNLLHGDFGMSMKFKGQSVIGDVQKGVPISAIVGLGGVLVGCIVGIILGSIAALNNKGFFDYAVIILAIICVSVPNFVFGSLLQRYFGVEWKLLPIQGWKSPLYWILPILAVSFTNVAYYARMLRSSMLDVCGQDYIITARSKGLNEREVVQRHMWRNSMLPLVTSLGPMLAGVLTGNFVIEKIFNIPGVGQSMIVAIQNSDYTMIMGLTIIFSFISILCYFVVDVVYGIVDPRIRIEA